MINGHTMLSGGYHQTILASSFASHYLAPFLNTVQVQAAVDLHRLKRVRAAVSMTILSEAKEKDRLFGVGLMYTRIDWPMIDRCLVRILISKSHLACEVV